MDWNSPASHLADDFLLESLSELGKKNKANALKFTSVDNIGANNRLKTVVSAVIDRMKRRKIKFSFMN